MDGLVGIVPIAKTMRIFIMAQSNTRPELKVHTHTSGSAFKNVWCKLKAAPSIHMTCTWGMSNRDVTTYRDMWIERSVRTEREGEN